MDTVTILLCNITNTRVLYCDIDFLTLLSRKCRQ